MKVAIVSLVALACLVMAPPVAAVREPVRARHAMVIAQQPADEAGLRVLQQGGNAIDAAIAIGFALNAAYPYAGALGGGARQHRRMAIVGRAGDRARLRTRPQEIRKALVGRGSGAGHCPGDQRVSGVLCLR